MKKCVVLAEKPSMAKSIAEALGSYQAKNGYFEVDNFLITFCIGHLLELCHPERYNPNWKIWKREDLPMLPKKLLYQPKPKTLKQYKTIKNLLERADIESVINACDAGREGELIFWSVFNQVGVDLPVERLWISSLTRKSIIEGFSNLRDYSEFEGLKTSAFLRAKADWLVGMNATRVQTLVAKEKGAEDVFSIGRVQTPTLALVVKRDLNIEGFESKPYWEISGTFIEMNGRQEFSASFLNQENKVHKFLEKDQAEDIISKIQRVKDELNLESIEKKTIKRNNPLLFDLTSLQRFLNQRLFTAEKTLKLCQSLYEQRLITYPRTSSRYLSESVNQEDVPKVLDALYRTEKYDEYLEQIIVKKQGLTKRHVNDKKVTDHHAIIPTVNTKTETLTEDEILVYKAILQQFLRAFEEKGVDVKKEITISLGGKYHFLAKGTTILQEGWRQIKILESRNKNQDSKLEDSRLPEFDETSDLVVRGLELVDKKTRPPQRFNDSTLLGAMETAGKLLKDEEEREAMKELGLGTPATRAAMIEKLLSIGYLTRKKKSLISTTKGRELIENLQKCKSNLISPELTGKWERALLLISKGQYEEEKFNQVLVKFVKKIVEQVQSQEGKFSVESLGDCPKCKAENRSGILKKIKSKKSGHKFLVCNQEKSVCGYISKFPRSQKDLQMILTQSCPKCSSALQFQISKKKTKFYPCIAKNCDGVIWDNTKRRKRNVVRK